LPAGYKKGCPRKTREPDVTHRVLVVEVSDSMLVQPHKMLI
jgi:hypothetical protein